MLRYLKELAITRFYRLTEPNSIKALCYSKEFDTMVIKQLLSVVAATGTCPKRKDQPHKSTIYVAGKTLEIFPNLFILNSKVPCYGRPSIEVINLLEKVKWDSTERERMAVVGEIRELVHGRLS